MTKNKGPVKSVPTLSNGFVSVILSKGKGADNATFMHFFLFLTHKSFKMFLSCMLKLSLHRHGTFANENCLQSIMLYNSLVVTFADASSPIYPEAGASILHTLDFDRYNICIFKSYNFENRVTAHYVLFPSK